MRLDRTYTGTTPTATGVITPLVRATGHIGWIAGVLDPLAPQDYDDAQRTRINSEFAAALDHLSASTPATPWVSQQTIEAQQAISQQISTAMTSMEERDDVIHNVKILLHNMAHVVALYEQDASGVPADAGAQV